MNGNKLYRSDGVLRYVKTDDHLKVILEIDPEVARFYRSFIPKYKCVNWPRYAPHISVVRKEIVLDSTEWGRYNNEVIDFWYDGQIYNENLYWWINAYSIRLEEIRSGLGLDNISRFLQPPKPFEKCFHITIANNK